MENKETGKKDSQPISNIDRIIHEPSRYMIMAYLYVVDSADFLFMVNQTGMTWGNISAHVSKLEESGYVAVEKEFLGKKPHTVLKLTDSGRAAFDSYRNNMKQILDGLPEK